MVSIKEKSKFLKEDNQIFYVDKYGRKWNKKCLDELFEAITKKRETEETLEYYSYKDPKMTLKVMKKLTDVFKGHEWDEK